MPRKRTGDKPAEILSFIRERLRTNGYPPSIREIGSAVGLSSSSTVHGYLNRLEEDGLIRRDPTKPRAIELVSESPWRQKEMIPVPLVGRVTAGLPILAEENIEDTFPLPASLLGRGNEDLFMLTVSGESMIKVGIHDGDFLLVRPSDSAKNGDIVVALVDGEEATVKRFWKDGKQILLKPENDAMEPIRPEHVDILGHVVGLFRKF
nr:transcriptional repressor LexA [uncultured Anaeromusa sp.]